MRVTGNGQGDSAIEATWDGPKSSSGKLFYDDATDASADGDDTPKCTVTINGKGFPNVTDADGNTPDKLCVWRICEKGGGPNAMTNDADKKEGHLADAGKVVIKPNAKNIDKEGTANYVVHAGVMKDGVFHSQLTVAIQIKCRTCESCAGGGGGDGSSGQPGSAGCSLDSVNVTVGLGRTDSAGSTAALSLQSKTIDLMNLKLYSPRALVLSSRGKVRTCLEAGILRQVRTMDALTDVTINDSTSYTLSFYSFYGQADPGDGVYVTPTGTPYQTITIDKPASLPQLRVTEAGDHNRTSVYTYDLVNNIWELSTGNGFRVERLEGAPLSDTQPYTETRTIKNAVGETISKVVSVYQAFPFGVRLTSEAVGDGSTVLTTTWDYYSNASADGANFGCIKSMQKPNGYWEAYRYDSQGRIIKQVAQFLNAPFGSDEAACRVTTKTYATTNPVRTEIETLLGTEIRRTYHSSSVGESRDIVCQRAGASANAADNLVTITRTYTSGDNKGKTQSVVHPDGHIDLYEYSTGSGSTVTTVTSGAPNATGQAVVSGTRTVTVTDGAGNEVSMQKYDVASSLLIDWEQSKGGDQFGRPGGFDYLGGRYRIVTYECCGIDTEVSSGGHAVTYGYDILGRQNSEQRFGSGVVGHSGIKTVRELDPVGQTLSTIRIGFPQHGETQTYIVLSRASYNVVGQQLTSTDARNQVTTYSEQTPSGGGTVKTTIYPDGSTRVETYAGDDSLLSVTGSNVHPIQYEYGVENGLSYQKEIRPSAGNPAGEWTKTYTDLVGRQIKTSYPDGSSETTHYNTKGQLDSRQSASGVSALYTYNARGEQERVVIDMNRNGLIDENGTDRIQQTQTQFYTAHGKTVCGVTTTEWKNNGAGDTIVTSLLEQSVDSLQTWQTSYGLTTHSVTDYNSSIPLIVRTDMPDGSYTIEKSPGGRLLSSDRYDSAGNQISGTYINYDQHGRVAKSTDLRNGETTFAYYDDDQIYTQTTPPPDDQSPAQATTSTYDPLTGRLQTKTLPNASIVHYEYWPTGELKRIYGSQTYDTSYSYDWQGRLKTLTAGAGTTTWNYDGQRGWLNQKRYHDNKGPNYTYFPGGRMKTRTWARGAVTTYGYDNADGLSSVTYSDGTPAVTYTPDRRGRVIQTSDAAGLHTLGYNNAGQLTGDSVDAGGSGGNWLAGAATTVGYDTLLRRGSFGLSLGGQVQFNDVLGYDGASRLQSVSRGAYQAVYSYESDSSLLDGVTYRNNGSYVAGYLRSYDHLNRLRQLQRVTNPSPRGRVINEFTYEYDALNRRTRVDEQDGYWLYGHDEMGQVTSAIKYTADGAPYGGEQFGYAFDGIGNRTSVTSNGQTSTYTPNALNQYSQRTVPGAVDVQGTVMDGATQVSVASAAANSGTGVASMQEEHYFAQLGVNNATGRAVGSAMVSQDLADGTSQSETRAFAVPKTPESFVYDDDGNLKSDGLWTYNWDAENRLTEMTGYAENQSDGTQRRLRFGYDGRGRRIRKEVARQSVGAWVQEKDTRFVYDEGWNVVAEVAGASGLLSKSYLWGLDLSGSLRGAGGVGGLVAVALPSTNGTATYFARYDGNGNVRGLLTDGGAEAASYEYGAFGESIGVVGSTLAAANPFRFSNHYLDEEASLYYAKYRYYSVRIGRWLNMDPIEEDGGCNLYAYLSNSPLAGVDPMGLALDAAMDPKSIAPIYVPSIANGGAETKGAWPPHIAEKQTRANGCRWEVKISGSLPITINVVSGTDLTSVDEQGHEVLEHERIHAAIYAKWWNMLKRVVDKKEQVYCVESCADLALKIVEANSSLAKFSAYAENAQFDLNAYPNLMSEPYKKKKESELKRYNDQVDTLKKSVKELEKKWSSGICAKSP